MKKEEFKKLIKESVKEVLIEEGVLSTIVSEVLKGANVTQQAQIQEHVAPAPAVVSEQRQEKRRIESEKLAETKKKMLEAIGETSYNGVNLFEGTKPLSKGSASGTAAAASPIANMDPSDAGVDISSLLGKADVWKKLAE